MKNNSSDKKQIVKQIGKQGNKKTSEKQQPEKHNRKNQKPVENGKMPESKGYPCPYFKKCGGCRLLNMSYEEQLKHKQSTVAKNLKDIASAQGVKISKIVPGHGEATLFYLSHHKPCI